MKTPMTPERRAELDERGSRISSIVRPLATARYGVDVAFNDIESMLDYYRRDFGINLAPDYQRGRVWDRRQQEHDLENVIRGVIPQGGIHVMWNCANWDEDDYAGDLPRGLEIIDGLQRLTAVREFVAGEFPVFGSLYAKDLDGTSFSMKRPIWSLRFSIHTFQCRKDLLTHYLDINSGGTPHSQSELDRVRGLLAA